jgi:hypothetical protein
VQVGFVLFVDGEVTKMPENELARDCVMPEGPQDDMRIMCALLTSIPRDGDNNSELWTTVDPNKTNVRSKGIMKLIQVCSSVVVVKPTLHRFATLLTVRYAGVLHLPDSHVQERLLRGQNRVPIP